MVLDQVAFLLAGACVANAVHPALIRWTGWAPQDSITFLEPLQFLLPPLLAAYAWTAMRGEHAWFPWSTGPCFPFKWLPTSSPRWRCSIATRPASPNDCRTWARSTWVG